MNLLMQVMKSGKPEQLLLSMMNPQQRQIAEAFLAKPNREQALEELKQFLRYFSKNVLKDGDSVRKYVEKHKPKQDGN